MKTRIIHTKIWDDQYFADLKPVEKLLFLYFFTNQRIGLSGMYELSDRTILFETGVNLQQLEAAKEEFQKAKKIICFKGWVYVVKSSLLGGYTGSKNEVALEKELSLIPEDIRSYFKDTVSIGYQYPSDTSINHKSEIINHKEVVKEIPLEHSKSYLQHIPESDLENLHAKYSCSISQIKTEAEAIVLYCDSKGKKYSNYSSALQNWLLRKYGKRTQPLPPKFEMEFNEKTGQYRQVIKSSPVQA